MSVTADEVFAVVRPALAPLEDGRPIVLMTCGLAGSGKTTLAKNVLSHFSEFVRLSNDEIVAAKHGLYGKDYPASLGLHDQYLEEADQDFLAMLNSRLREKKNIILDRSLYAQADRNELKEIVSKGGGQWVLVFLRVSTEGKETLWGRICARSAGERDANSALEIPRDLFERYWAGFEEPKGEGEITINVM